MNARGGLALSDHNSNDDVQPDGGRHVMTASPPGSSRSAVAQTGGSGRWTLVLIVLGAVAAAGGVVFLLSAFGVAPFSTFEVPWPDWFKASSSTIGKFGLMAFAVAIFVAVMALILLSVDRASKVPNWALVLGFLGPAGLMLAFGLLYPMLRTIRESFFDRNGANFIGWDNYVTIFTQSEFQIVLRNTMIWVIVVPIVSTFIGLLYAVLVDRTRFEALAKGLIFLPMAISLVGASIIWKFVYEFRPDQQGVEQIGLANQLLVWAGLDPNQFLISNPWNTFWLLIVMIWIQTGFAMTILSAAIKAIPDDIVEAARLDGLTGPRMFRYITVPSIRPALVVVLVTVTMTTLKVFDIVRTMTGGQFETSVVANEFYTQSFRQFNFGLGASLAVILFVLVIPVVVYQVRQLRLAEDIR
nr:sugar ABC transporter permease [Phytoactinopolyspora alkaliphila]